jgi:hypothetical protein
MRPGPPPPGLLGVSGAADARLPPAAAWQRSTPATSWCSTTWRRTRSRASAGDRRRRRLHPHLPLYSLDLNPIEQLFAKLKTLLRKAATRSRDAPWRIIGRLIAALSPAECSNYLKALRLWSHRT